MKITKATSFTATIEFDFVELIGLYKMSMAKIDPEDIFHEDHDILEMSARLQVQLAHIIDSA